MRPHGSDQLRRTIDALYRSESGRVLATLVRLLGDLDLAEESMHEAFAAALEAWPRTGIPEKPRLWLVSTARFKAIDNLRRRARFDRVRDALALHTRSLLDDAQSTQEPIDGAAPGQEATAGEEITDDRLRLIFTCCHPALPQEGQVALTLRDVCGLTTEEIARAFLVAPGTLAQRIVRAKAVIRSRSIPYQVPGPAELPARLDAVLQVVYLIYNEGYSAGTTRAALSHEALRLGRLVLDLLQLHGVEEPEAMGLLGLMLLQESRRRARTTPEGDLILLEQQDRSLWDRGQIAEGVSLARKALHSHRFGAYTLQAAIAAEHAESSSAASTNWREITRLYDRLLAVHPSPVVALNRAVAVAMCDGPEAGLLLINALLERGELASYSLAHAARADLCRRLGRAAEARSSYERALALAQQEPERRFLQGQIRRLQ